MKDYITTAFTVIVGLLDADKLVYLALVGLGILLVWQMFSLLASFHASLARRCRKISKFLNTKGLSSSNYNAFLGLVAKMPQEFIRGYKAFEHASYGLPSDYIRRFDSVDVEVNGGITKQGRSLQKAFIYMWAMIIALVSLALMGEEFTGLALADALLTPALFIILARVLYYIYAAIRQQQYRVAVDEFNEMLDIMNDKIENNDNLPGPDILTDIYSEICGENEARPAAPNAEQQSAVQTAAEQTYNASEQIDSQIIDESVSPEVAQDEPYESVQADVPEQEDVQMQDSYSREQLLSSVQEPQEEDNQMPSNGQQTTEVENALPGELVGLLDQIEQDAYTKVEEPSAPAPKFAQPAPKQNQAEVAAADSKDNFNAKKQVISTQKSEEVMEQELGEKRGRGRPKKVPEGQLVIKSDKEFEEVLERAEKLMRKSQTALSSSQAKRVEKSLKELLDAMTKYKESQQ